MHSSMKNVNQSFFAFENYEKYTMIQIPKRKI